MTARLKKPHIFKIHFNIILTLTSISPKRFLLSGFLRALYAFLISLVLHAPPIRSRNIVKNGPEPYGREEACPAVPLYMPEPPLTWSHPPSSKSIRCAAPLTRGTGSSLGQSAGSRLNTFCCTMHGATPPVTYTSSLRTGTTLGSI